MRGHRRGRALHPIGGTRLFHAPQRPAMPSLLVVKEGNWGDRISAGAGTLGDNGRGSGGLKTPLVVSDKGKEMGPAVLGPAKCLSLSL